MYGGATDQGSEYQNMVSPPENSLCSQYTQKLTSDLLLTLCTEALTHLRSYTGVPVTVGLQLATATGCLGRCSPSKRQSYRTRRHPSRYMLYINTASANVFSSLRNTATLVANGSDISDQVTFNADGLRVSTL